MNSLFLGPLRHFQIKTDLSYLSSFFPSILPLWKDGDEILMKLNKRFVPEGRCRKGSGKKVLRGEKKKRMVGQLD